jgi:hypothetical protein
MVWVNVSLFRLEFCDAAQTAPSQVQRGRSVVLLAPYGNVELPINK